MQPDTRIREWTDDQHQVAELERDAAWHAGYEAGRADERTDLETGAREIARSPFPPYLSPAAEQVVAGLVERLLAESRPSTALPAVNHPGGSVPYWGDDRVTEAQAIMPGTGARA